MTFVQISVTLESLAYSRTFDRFDRVVLDLAAQAASYTSAHQTLADFIPALEDLNVSFIRLQRCVRLQAPLQVCRC